MQFHLDIAFASFLTILMFRKTRNVSWEGVALQCQPVSIFLHGDYESVSPAQIVMVLVLMLVMGVASFIKILALLTSSENV